MLRFHARLSPGLLTWAMCVPFRLIASCVISGLFVMASLQLLQESDAVDAALVELTRRSPVVLAVPTPPTNQASSDFVTDLPTKTSRAWAHTVIETAAQHASVSVKRLAVEPRPSEPNHLHVVEISVGLTGAYSDVKRFLAEVMSRLPGVTLERLQMQRSPASTDPETSLVLKLWSQPGKADQQAPAQADH